MRVKAINDLVISERWWGWIEIKASPNSLNGRRAMFIRGCSGQERWHIATVTAPEKWFTDDKSISLIIPKGAVYEFTYDKKDAPLVRIYKEGSYNEEAVIIETEAHLKGDAVIEGVEGEGYSRTGKNGDYWSLSAVRPDTLVKKYYYDDNEPCYVSFTKQGEEKAYSCSTSPEEW